MSSLTENLQQIYSIKQEIKEAIGTTSDIFSDYPAYISAMAGGITPSGSYSITVNGNYDVTSYATAAVNVPIPAGYIQPSGTITIDDSVNGTTVDVSAYAYADVEVISSGGGLEFDPYHSQANVFKPITYSGMFDSSGLMGGGLNSWNIDYVGVTIDQSTYVFQQINVIPLCGTDIPENIAIMEPNDFGLTTAHYWTAYDDAGNQINLYTNDCFLNLEARNDFAHIQYQNNSGDKQYIKFVSSELQWNSANREWQNNYTDTEMNTFPVVEYSEINGASSTHNGTYLFLPDGGSIDLYLNFIPGDMGYPDSCIVYAGVTDDNSGQTLWYNIEETPLSGVNFIEYDENNWPPQA